MASEASRDTTRERSVHVLHSRGFSQVTVFRLVNPNNGSLHDLLHLVFSISQHFFHLKQKSINVSLSLWHLKECNF